MDAGAGPAGAAPAALAPPSRELGHGRPRRVVGDHRGLRDRVGLHGEHAWPLSERLLGERLPRGPVRPGDLEHRRRPLSRHDTGLLGPGPVLSVNGIPRWGIPWL